MRAAPRADSRRRGRARSSRRLVAVLWIGCVLLAAGTVAVAVTLLRGAESPVGPATSRGEGPSRGSGVPSATSPAASPAPSYYVDVPSQGAFRPIADRGDDPRPLTAREVFSAGAKSPEYGDVKLVLRQSRATNCPAAVWGQRLEQRLQRNGCSQAVRGSYEDPERGVVGMVAIFNMADVEGATAIIEELDPGHRGGFVLPLGGGAGGGGGGTGSIASIGRGYSEAHAHAMGHYVFVRWAQRMDGSTPDPAAGSHVSDAAVALTDAQRAIRQRVLAASFGHRS